MKFAVTSTALNSAIVCGFNEGEEPKPIEFETLEEFFKWVDDQPYLVIIGKKENDVQMLELYDDYRE